MRTRSPAEQNTTPVKPSAPHPPIPTVVSPSRRPLTTRVAATRRLLAQQTLCFTGFEQTESAATEDAGIRPSTGLVTSVPLLPPLRKKTLQDCISIAHELGATVQPHLKKSTMWLVAAQGLSAKRVMAEKIGIPVVGAGWLTEVRAAATRQHSADDNDDDDEAARLAILRKARTQCQMRCLHGYVFSSTHLGHDEANTLHGLLAECGAELSGSLGTSCEALLLSREDASLLRRGVRRLPAEVPAPSSRFAEAAGARGLSPSRSPAVPSTSKAKNVKANLRAATAANTTLSVTQQDAVAGDAGPAPAMKHLASPLAPFLGPQFTAKVWFAWRHGIPVVPYDHVLQAVRGLDDNVLQAEDDPHQPQQQRGRDALRRARWSEQSDMDLLLESGRLHPPPPQWLVREDEWEQQQEQDSGEEEIATGIGSGFVTRPFAATARRRPQRVRDPTSPTSVSVSDAETVSAASLSLSLSPYFDSMSTSSIDGFDGSLPHVHDEDNGGHGDAQLPFVRASETGAVLESCASNALVTQPDYFSLSHTVGSEDVDNAVDGDDATAQGHPVRAGAGDGGDVATYYALKRQAKTTIGVHMLPPHHPVASDVPTARQAFNAPRSGGTFANAAATQEADDDVSDEDNITNNNGRTTADVREKRGRTQGGRESAGNVASSSPPSWWYLTPRNRTAHLQVVLMGCTQDELLQGTAACIACRFFRSPIPTSRTDLVVLGSDILKKKKFIDRAALRRGKEAAKGTSLRRQATASAHKQKERAHQGSMRVFYECQPAVMDELEQLYGIPARQVVPLAWLRACLAKVQEKPSAGPRPRVSAAVPSPLPYTTQEDGAEETGRWPSVLLGPASDVVDATLDSARVSSTKTVSDAARGAVFEPLPPLSLDELPDPRDRHFRIQRRAEAFTEPPPADAETAAVPGSPTAPSAAGGAAATKPADSSALAQRPPPQQQQQQQQLPHSTRALGPTTARVLTPEEQFQYDRDRAARVMRGLFDLLVSSEDDGGVATLRDGWKQARLVEAHALRGVLICLVDGDFDRSDLAVARGLINVGGGQWVKKGLDDWRQVLSKRGNTGVARGGTDRSAPLALADASQSKPEEDASSMIVERVRLQAVYGKRIAKWWGRKHLLRVPTVGTKTGAVFDEESQTLAGVTAECPSRYGTAALGNHDESSIQGMPGSAFGENSLWEASVSQPFPSSSSSPALAHKEVAQLQRLARTCIKSPVMCLIPHAHQRPKEADSQTSATAATSTQNAAAKQSAMRLVPSVTTDYLLACLACGHVLSPEACFLFCTPIPSAPDMKLLQHTTRRAGQQNNNNNNNSKSSAVSGAADHQQQQQQPPLISPWVWERRYAKARAVGVSISVVWRIAHTHLIASDETVESDTGTAIPDSHVPDAETAALMRVMLYGLHHVITALGGTLSDVFDPSAVTHLLCVDVEAIRGSRWRDLYVPNEADEGLTLNAAAGDQGAPRRYWPARDVAMAAPLTTSTTATAAADGSEAVSAVTLPWLEASVKWGVFVHEATSPGFHWQPPAPRHAGSETGRTPIAARSSPKARITDEETRSARSRSPKHTPYALRQKQQLIAQQLAKVRAESTTAMKRMPDSDGHMDSRHGSTSPVPQHSPTASSHERARTPPPPQSQPPLPVFATVLSEEECGVARHGLHASAASVPSRRESHSRRSCCTPPQRPRCHGDLHGRESPSEHDPHQPPRGQATVMTTMHSLSQSTSRPPPPPPMTTAATPRRSPSHTHSLTATHNNSSSSGSQLQASQQHNTQSRTAQQETDRYLAHLGDRFQFHTPASTPVPKQPTSSSCVCQPLPPHQSPHLHSRRGDGVLCSPSPAPRPTSHTPRRASLREQSAALEATPVSAFALSAMIDLTDKSQGRRAEDVDENDDDAEEKETKDKTKSAASSGDDANCHPDSTNSSSERKRPRDGDGDRHNASDEASQPTKRARHSARALRFSPETGNASSGESSPRLSPAHVSNPHGAKEHETLSVPRVLARDSFVGASPARAVPKTSVTHIDARPSTAERASPYQPQRRGSEWAHSQGSGVSSEPHQRRTMAEQLMLLAGGLDEGTGTRSSEASRDETLNASTRSTLDGVVRVSALTNDADAQEMAVGAPRLGAASRSTTPPPPPPRQPLASRSPVPVEVVVSDEEHADGDSAQADTRSAKPRSVTSRQLSLARRGLATSAIANDPNVSDGKGEEDNASADVNAARARTALSWRPLRLYVLHDVPHRDALITRCERLCAKLPHALPETHERGSAAASRGQRPGKRPRSFATTRSDGEEETVSARGESLSAAQHPIAFVARCEDADVVVTHEITARETVLSAVAAGIWVVRPTALDDLAERLGRGFDHFRVADPIPDASKTHAAAAVAANVDSLRWLESHEWGPEFMPAAAPPLHTQLARQCRQRRRAALQQKQGASPHQTGLFAQARFVLFLAPPVLSSSPSPTKSTDSRGRPSGDLTPKAVTAGREPAPHGDSSGVTRSSGLTPHASTAASQESRRMDKRFGAVRHLIAAGGGVVCEVVMLRGQTPSAAPTATTTTTKASTPFSSPSEPVLCFPQSTTSATTDSSGSSVESYLAQLIVSAVTRHAERDDDAAADTTCGVASEVLLLVDTPLLTASLAGAALGTEKTGEKATTVPLLTWLTEQLATSRSSLMTDIKSRLAARATETGNRPRKQTVRLSLRSFSWLARFIAGDETAEAHEGGTFCVVQLSV